MQGSDIKTVFEVTELYWRNALKDKRKRVERGKKNYHLLRVKKSLRLHHCSESLRKANGETQDKNNVETSVQSSPTLAFTVLGH